MFSTRFCTGSTSATRNSRQSDLPARLTESAMKRPSVLSAPISSSAVSKNCGSTMKFTAMSSMPARSISCDAPRPRNSSSPAFSVTGSPPLMRCTVLPEHMYMISI